MALNLNIDWHNRIIFIPRAGMTLVQSTPVEIRDLNLNTFRLELKSLEDDEGMPYVDTHNHIAPISVGSVALSRVVEIINDYTITFEDGQYAVNLVGANSNVGDRVNVNQVSVRSANATGLVEVEKVDFTKTDIAVAVWESLQAEHRNKGTMGDQMHRAVVNASNAFALAAAKA